jgi:hypothetical protein
VRSKIVFIFLTKITFYSLSIMISKNYKNESIGDLHSFIALI